MQNHPSTTSNQPSPCYKTEDWDTLEAQLERALLPVTPSPEFRARLRYGLRMAAYHREMHQLLVRERAEMPWGWLVGAAALGSAAGLLTIFLRMRQTRLGALTTVAENK
jgi:hypothetical protein